MDRGSVRVEAEHSANDLFRGRDYCRLVVSPAFTLIDRSCSHLWICSVLAAKKIKKWRKSSFPAGELYLNLVRMLFLRSCCKHEASENRYFVQQRLVWIRFSSLIRMICTLRQCDKARKFPHITLPLTEQFDLCGYYNSARPDKHIIIAERKGIWLNVQHLPANVLYHFRAFWAVDCAFCCSA